MPVVKFTEEDIKASFLVQNPDWYNYEITKITNKPAKSDGSPNNWITFKGVDSPESKSNEMAGVLVTKCYSSKAGWALLPLIIAANGGKEVPAGQDFELNDLIGIQINAMTRRGDFNGSQVNDLVDFRPKK